MAKKLTTIQKRAVRKAIRMALDQILGSESFADGVNGQIIDHSEATGFDQDDHFEEVDAIKADVISAIETAADAICEDD